MLFSRLFSGISFLGFALTLGGTLRLAATEWMWPTATGNARHALRAAVRLNPRDSAAWMGLGLAAERNGDMEQARDCFLEAEKVDRQYLPAWTSANFFFRRGNDLQFWRAATRAAAMSYDDLAPLIELADHREPDAIAALQRLGNSAGLERGYLRLLIRQGRWQEAEDVSVRLSLRGDARDRELLLHFTDRLIEAKKGPAALRAWNRLQQFPAPERASRGMLVNQNFQTQPSGHGFDWRVTEPPRGSVHWDRSKLEFWLADSIPDACTLLEQWVLLDRGPYRLRFQYRTDGLAEETGLRWRLLHDGREAASSAVLAPAPKRISDGTFAEWNFQVAKADLYQLAWIYSRVPGTIHHEGRAELAFVGLEAP